MAVEIAVLVGVDYGVLVDRVEEVSIVGDHLVVHDFVGNCPGEL